MTGKEINCPAQRIGINAVGETGTGERLRLDAVRRHRVRCRLHHGIGNHLVIGAMHQQHRRTAIGETDAVGRQQRAGKADNRRRRAGMRNPQ